MEFQPGLLRASPSSIAASGYACRHRLTRKAAANRLDAAQSTARAAAANEDGPERLLETPLRHQRSRSCRPATRDKAALPSRKGLPRQARDRAPTTEHGQARPTRSQPVGVT